VLPGVEREQVLLVQHDAVRVLPHLVVMELLVDPVVGQKNPSPGRRFRACPQVLFPVRLATKRSLDGARQVGLRLRARSPEIVEVHLVQVSAIVGHRLAALQLRVLPEREVRFVLALVERNLLHLRPDLVDLLDVPLVQLDVLLDLLG